MQNILDAIQSGNATAEDFASLELPESYRAAFVHEGRGGHVRGPHRQGEGPPQVPPRRGRAAARARSR